MNVVDATGTEASSASLSLPGWLAEGMTANARQELERSGVDARMWFFYDSAFRFLGQALARLRINEALDDDPAKIAALNQLVAALRAGHTSLSPPDNADVEFWQSTRGKLDQLEADLAEAEHWLSSPIEPDRTATEVAMRFL